MKQRNSTFGASKIGGSNKVNMLTNSAVTEIFIEWHILKINKSGI